MSKTTKPEHNDERMMWGVDKRCIYNEPVYSEFGKAKRKWGE